MDLRHAMPEWLTRLDRDAAPWVVVAGKAQRGEAFTDLVAHRMQVPMGADETSRCIRAHEMMHAKVSPTVVTVPSDLGHLSPSTLIVAEEFRVNMLVGSAGFPVMKYLADGSEKRLGERLAVNRDWNETVHMLAATSGTKALSGLLAGVKLVQPLWIPTLSELNRQLQKLWRKHTRDGTAAVASTEPCDDVTEGWGFTILVAQLIHRALITETSDDPVPPDPSRLGGAGASEVGKFAVMLELHLDRPNRVNGFLGRRKRASNIGRHPRHLERLLTDPERRIFDRRARCQGGVVLIDQSGSMQLTEDDLWRVINAAPGCVIIGYSHAPHSVETPNIWVLADRGAVTDKVPPGNGGNGVDGPALEFALKKRKNRESMIWICDGHVTDGSDQYESDLTEECGRLVALHDIHQVADLETAIHALTLAARGKRLMAAAVGPIAATKAWRTSHS